MFSSIGAADGGDGLITGSTLVTEAAGSTLESGEVLFAEEFFGLAIFAKISDNLCNASTVLNSSDGIFFARFALRALIKASAAQQMSCAGACSGILTWARWNDTESETRSDLVAGI